MKKIGILNVQWVDNYGAVLLAYALQESVEKLGYQAEIIDYRPLPSSAAKSSLLKRISQRISQDGVKGFFYYFYRKVNKQKAYYNVNVSSEKKRQRFNNFRQKFLHRSKIYHNITKDDDLRYDAYIVGSDVVWKPERILSEESQIYFLNFTEGQRCGRVAYAASLMTDNKELLEQVKGKLEQYIQRFDYVSIRERSLIPFVEGVYKKPIFCCIDPTLLLTSLDYDKLIPIELNNSLNEDYIYYYVFEDNDTAFKLVNEYSKKLNMPVVCQCVSPHKINSLLDFSCDDGPIEFLNHIKHANFVITDSFHGTIFSIIYKKNFITLSRGRFSVRMDDLLKELELSDHYVNGYNIPLNINQIDYTRVDNLIKEWKEESLNYLIQALNNVCDS